MEWIIPPLREERGEFERVAETFGVRVSLLVAMFQVGTIEDLTDEAWGVLENTDSWHTTTLEKVFEKATEYGRNAQKLLREFYSDRTMQVPIVLVLSTGAEHLVSGNTHLMLCRALGIRPRVLKIRFQF